MALIIILRNVSELAPTSDYEYRVQVNERIIEAGKVLQHQRSDGWAALLKQLLEQREENQS